MLTRRTLCPATLPPATSGTARRTTWTPRTRRWWTSPTTGAPSPSSPPGEDWDSHQVVMFYICNCRNDIGIAVDCLQQCNDAGASCLAVLLRNERGGRQSCSSVTRCRDIIYRYYLHISTLYLSTILISSIYHVIYLSTVLISIIVTSSAVADGTDPTSATGVTYFEKICISKLNIFSKYQIWTNLDSFSSFSISIDPLFNCSIQQPLHGL